MGSTELYPYLALLENTSTIIVSAISPAELDGYLFYIETDESDIVCRRSSGRSGVLEILENDSGEHMFNIHNAEVENEPVEATHNNGMLLGRIKQDVASVIDDDNKQAISKSCKFQRTRRGGGNQFEISSLVRKRPVGTIRFASKVVNLDFKAGFNRVEIALVLTYAVIHALTTHRQLILESPHRLFCNCLRAFTFANLSVSHKELSTLGTIKDIKMRRVLDSATPSPIFTLDLDNDATMLCNRSENPDGTLHIASVPEGNVLFVITGATSTKSSVLTTYTESSRLGDIWGNDLYFAEFAETQQIFREYVFRYIGATGTSHRYHVTRTIDDVDVSHILFDGEFVDFQFYEAVVPPWLKAMIISYGVYHSLTTHAI